VDVDETARKIEGQTESAKKTPRQSESTTLEVRNAAWIRSRPVLPAISTSFLNNTQYLRKRRWLKRHTIKGRLPHPPVLSATADLEKSHANKDAAVRKTTVKMRRCSVFVPVIDVQVTQSRYLKVGKAFRHSILASKT
jgi:hypothetical protein